MSSRRDKVDFGFEDVARDQKARKVRGVFDSVAGNYDLMNDLMSGGLHRLWKRFTIERSGLRPGGHALDVAGGTGDIARALADRVGPKGRVVLSDINAQMLSRGRDALIDAGHVGDVHCVQADAECLPFEPGSFDCVTIGFGLRNVTDREAALASMGRCLKPGGRLLVLEFSKPAVKAIEPLYDAYSLKVLPMLGQMFAGDADSYRYLAESIRRFPDQETLKTMMESAGLERVSYHNLTAGVVALHVGYRC